MSDTISKTRKHVHMSNSGVHNLELSNYHTVGGSQDATMAMQNKAWFQDIPPNYSPTQRGTLSGSQESESEMPVLGFPSPLHVHIAAHS